MEKLIELLNEYEKEVKKSEKVWSIDNDWDICIQTYEWVDYNEYTEYMNTNNLISKSFWFIKWLIDNNKIDFSREWDLSIELVNLFERKLDNAEWVIALLSIQDDPINFLISILK